jgi:cysteinyl-tRNA synthetase
MVRIINLVSDGKEKISASDKDKLSALMSKLLFDILGLRDNTTGAGSEMLPKVIGLLLEVRQEAKKEKNFGMSDHIRDELGKIGITVKDRKDGADWEIQ